MEKEGNSIFMCILEKHYRYAKDLVFVTWAKLWSQNGIPEVTNKSDDTKHYYA